ncbi:phage neck terminator protein [Paenibacillus oleatilyticus]|uniref:Phage neck terminator protein gp12-like domain-containing protein n=1 Tax=Paenibacillus oleatilyticus TaxID=2594886 RepID=A0ABV4UY35_9BACL
MDKVNSISQIEDLFQGFTIRALGLDPRAKQNQDRVRIGWPAKGAPAWKQGADVAFLLIDYADDQYTRQIDVTFSSGANKDNANRTVSYTRVLRVNWIFYGPNSFGDADTVRAGLFLPQTTMDLAAVNMAMITDVAMPIRTPELFAGQWWDRTSFQARFNEKVTRQSEVPYLQSANVQIVKE